LEEELLLTPWNLTSNFIAATQGKGMLQLTGLGDPSGGRGEAFSYVRMPQKQQHQQSKKRKESLPKSQVTGTDADLRKLSLDNARLVLLKFGVSEEEIKELSRWERIARVRKMSRYPLDVILLP
jgi:transcription initiation factor TFIID subunit 1